MLNSLVILLKNCVYYNKLYEYNVKKNIITCLRETVCTKVVSVFYKYRHFSILGFCMVSFF